MYPCLFASTLLLAAAAENLLSSPQINCSNIQTLPSFAELNSFAPLKINVIPSSRPKLLSHFWRLLSFLFLPYPTNKN